MPVSDLLALSLIWFLFSGCYTLECWARLRGRNSQASGRKPRPHQTRTSHQEQDHSWQAAAGPYACKYCNVSSFSILWFICSNFVVSFCLFLCVSLSVSVLSVVHNNTVLFKQTLRGLLVRTICLLFVQIFICFPAEVTIVTGNSLKRSDVLYVSG